VFFPVLVKQKKYFCFWGITTLNSKHVGWLANKPLLFPFTGLALLMITLQVSNYRPIEATSIIGRGVMWSIG